MCYVKVHVLDRNDNAPQFINFEYRGFISEAAPVGSLVLTKDNVPLTLKAHDNDFELNALLQYEIVEATSKRMFFVVSNTGMEKDRKYSKFNIWVECCFTKSV